jgi:hypothetical protein
VCTACGIAWVKWRARASREGRSQPARTAETPADAEGSLLSRLREQLMLMPEGMDGTGRGARIALLLALAVWTLWFGAHGIDWEIIGGSFLHRANLAFHEFGHLFFMPLGDTMTVLGGSLFQVLLPVALAAYFTALQQDNFAASAAIWWAGQNLVDLAPYIRDAEYRVLPLAGGRGEESHDWGNLLEHWNAVEQCHALARTSFMLGLLLMTAALAWGAALLWRAQREAGVR